MIRRVVALALGVLALLAPIAAGLVVRGERRHDVPSPRPVSRDALPPVSDHGNDLIRLASAGTPFRLWHHGPSVRFGAGQTPAVAASPPVPRPHPVLTGVLWGSTSAALLEGIPGHEGAVVMSKGDTAGGLRLTRLKHDRVTLTGMDTSWTLTVRQPWP
jgi:hypothetical protein